MKNPVILMGAMEAEISLFRASLQKLQERKWNGTVFFEGTMAGRDTVVVNCGVGKVQTAMTVQKAIDLYSPRCLFFWGIAGSLRDDLLPGDIIAGRDTVQHDFDSTAFKFKRGEIPPTGLRFISADKELYEKALSTEPLTGKIRGGRILTGDQFITDRFSQGKEYLTQELEGDCVDMEGAAAALVCNKNGVPHLILRTISDNSDGRQKINLREFLKNASRNSQHILNQILTGL